MPPGINEPDQRKVGQYAIQQIPTGINNPDRRKVGQYATQQMPPGINKHDRQNRQKVGQDATQQMPPGLHPVDEPKRLCYENNVLGYQGPRLHYGIVKGSSTIRRSIILYARTLP
eukprot:TRINITY_DN1010_c1_g1_i2.p4 TRINITY_DN1010_c1_g1~~TRINITY_DN1010_c1_g1_i2.p4  ORF type:complete len:115 (-),score=1.17 TRINITY_DN1010_c1_g1_i2:1428-1772(-)